MNNVGHGYFVRWFLSAVKAALIRSKKCSKEMKPTKKLKHEEYKISMHSPE